MRVRFDRLSLHRTGVQSDIGVPILQRVTRLSITFQKAARGEQARRYVPIDRAAATTHFWRMLHEVLSFLFGSMGFRKRPSAVELALL